MKRTIALVAMMTAFAVSISAQAVADVSVNSAEAVAKVSDKAVDNLTKGVAPAIGGSATPESQVDDKSSEAKSAQSQTTAAKPKPAATTKPAAGKSTSVKAAKSQASADTKAATADTVNADVKAGGEQTQSQAKSSEGEKTVNNETENAWEHEYTLAILIIIILFVLCPLVVIGLVGRYSRERRKAKYRLIEKSMECGQALPAEFFSHSAAPLETIRRRGFTCLGVGLGLVGFFTMIDVIAGVGVGMFVTLYAVGQLAIVFTSGKRRRADAEDPTSAPSQQDE